MKKAKVIGTVWATQKQETLKNSKLLLLQTLSFNDNAPKGTPFVAVDTVQAGIGDCVFYVTSKEATFPLKSRFAAVDASVVGIIDQTTVHGKTEHYL
mgnify:CR=1 FL=1